MGSSDVDCMMCLANLAAGAPYEDGVTRQYEGITHAMIGEVTTCAMEWWPEWEKWMVMPYEA